MTAHPDSSVDRPAHVLIVDDERQNRQLLEVMLMPEGFVLMTASSGEQALALVERQPPDLILLDIMMPGMDGYEVATKIKSNAATKNIPVIMITALDDRSARMRGLDAGAEDFLTKPVDRSELRMRVRNLLRLKAHGDYHDRYSHLLENEVGLRTADLVEGERLYRETFDAAPVGIVHVGLDGRWLRVNQRLCDLLGYTREELQAIAVQDLTPWEKEGAPTESVRRMTTGVPERHVVAERRYRRRDGSSMWASVNTSIHRDREGQIRHFISVLQDITERRALEAEVRQSITRLTASEQRYRMLLDGANDAIAVLTPEGIVREMNQRWVDITGRPREQLIGRHVRDFSTSNRSQEYATNYNDAVTQGTSRSPPVEIVKPDGATILMEFSRTNVDVVGEQLVLTIGRDVTDQRQLEEQLRQAQKLEVIGQLAGGVAHDFNNILTAIVGFSEILLMDLGPDNPSSLDVIEIKNAGHRAAGLTRQLLAFGRKQMLQPSLVDINEIITKMEPMLRRLIFEHVSLVMSLDQNLGTVKIDATQLEQIVVNLTVNAADAMPKGGKLTIETGNVSLDKSYLRHHLPVIPGAHVMLTVSDTGVGMDEQTTRHMFEPFFTTKEVGKGTGLGLATVYGIVKQSGGDIRVHSEVGFGTTFKIYLPQVTTSVPVAIDLTPPPGSAPHVTGTILLVEDDEAVRRLAFRVLEREGYQVLEAEGPPQALRLAAEFTGPIDLLLSDVIMPDSQGPPLFLRLKDLRAGLRVLYMSGYADEAIVRHGAIVDGTPFLQKPFTPLALKAKVREVLDASLPLTLSAH